MSTANETKNETVNETNNEINTETKNETNYAHQYKLSVTELTQMENNLGSNLNKYILDLNTELKYIKTLKERIGVFLLPQF